MSEPKKDNAKKAAPEKAQTEAPKREAIVRVKGKAIVGLREILAPGREVTAEDFRGGDATIKRLVEAGRLERV